METRRQGIPIDSDEPFSFIPIPVAERNPTGSEKVSPGVSVCVEDISEIESSMTTGIAASNTRRQVEVSPLIGRIASLDNSEDGLFPTSYLKCLTMSEGFLIGEALLKARWKMGVSKILAETLSPLDMGADNNVIGGHFKFVDWEENQTTDCH